MNFEPIKISEVKSEVLVLGSLAERGVILLSLDKPTANGTLIA